jgi:hypothetical protein
MTADKILKKYEDDNEYHFHTVDRKWIIEAMEEYAELQQKDVSTRTFIFSGWYAGEKFETKIKSVDKESAIAAFETTWDNHRWHMVQELS